MLGLLVTTTARTESQGWCQKRRILGNKINAVSSINKKNGLEWILYIM